MSADMRFVVKLVAGLVTGIVVVIAVLLLGIAEIAEAACKRDADRLETDWTYDFWAEGCYVEVDGHMVPLDNVRITDDGRVLS